MICKTKSLKIGKLILCGKQTPLKKNKNTMKDEITMVWPEDGDRGALIDFKKWEVTKSQIVTKLHRKQVKCAPPL